MPRRRGSSTSLARQLTELSIAAPQVAAHRLARMAASGPTPSAQDRKELTGMILEKQVAFVQSWQAMFAAGLQAQQAFASAWLDAATRAALGRPLRTAKAARKARDATLAIAASGLAPVHRKATANARRLARKKRR
jgi:hypothetical protein